MKKRLLSATSNTAKSNTRFVVAIDLTDSIFIRENREMKSDHIGGVLKAGLPEIRNFGKLGWES